MGRTEIQWTDMTWNPIRGCTRVSEGCRLCYAEVVAKRFSGPGLAYEGLVNAQGRWNGTVRFVPAHLKDPLKWKAPLRIFVNSMSDLFHENVEEQWLNEIYHVMENASHHTFQILTKRPERMQKYLAWRYGEGRIPARHIWHGVSVENQAAADERIPLLLQTPSAVRFLSLEPLLGPIDLRHRPTDEGVYVDWLRPELGLGHNTGADPEAYIKWAIIGGESGTGARPPQLKWFHDLVEQLHAAGVATFVKQLGKSYYRDNEFGDRARVFPADKKGGDWNEWPPELRVREFPQPARA